MERTLKTRIRDGESFYAPYVSMTDDRNSLLETYQQDSPDLVFVDLQHTPASDVEIVDFCTWSATHDVPAQLRIRHPKEAHLIGRYCDFGALSIVVPLVEDPDVVEAAVESFYYPPRGRRSWGPSNAYRADDHEGLSYADWWNENGILIAQFESVSAVERCRELALPGVDMVAFGGRDLELDLRRHPEPPWSTVEDCIAHVVQELDDMDVRVGRTKLPCGRFEEVD